MFSRRRCCSGHPRMRARLDFDLPLNSSTAANQECRQAGRPTYIRLTTREMKSSCMLSLLSCVCDVLVMVAKALFQKLLRNSEQKNNLK